MEWVDAHCHPTDTPASLDAIATARIRMAVMSARLDDLVVVAETAARFPEQVVPAYGVHPWFAHLLGSGPKKEHYTAVFGVCPSPDDLELLPDPVPLADHLAKIEHLLESDPRAIVGEVGLDRAFRVRIGDKLSPYKTRLEHQVVVLDAQLALAAKYRRSVSLHGVQAHMPLFDAVKPYKTIHAVDLHAYAGSGDLLRQYWQKLSVPVYVSISTIINNRAQAKVKEAIRGLPPTRILSESDYHAAGPTQLELVRTSVQWLTETIDGVDQNIIMQNFIDFLQ